MVSKRIGHYTDRLPIGQDRKRRAGASFSSTMNRRYFVSLLVPAVALSATALGQVSPTVKGSRDDLRDARTVYVDVGHDRALGEALAAELRRELPALAIAADPEGADLILRFSRSVADERPARRENWDQPPYSADQTISRTPPPPRRAPLPSERTAGEEPKAPGAFDAPTRFAFGAVLKRAGSGPMREAMSFKQPIRTKADTAARDFVRKFAKEYRRANGE